MSQPYSVHITQEAEADLYGIYRYIAVILKERLSAEGLYRRIRKAISALDHMPERIKLMDDEPWRSQGLRLLVIDNYVAVFLIDEKAVHVLRIFYGGMDIAKQLQS